jgi:GntR family transcriptional regulator
MQIHVSEADGTPYYTQVVQQIKHLVASGRLTSGERLPPVRKLAEQLLINPNTVARAYRELESEGVVASKRGSGVFVSDSGSPLSTKEKQRILHDRVDSLLVAARQLGVDMDSLLTTIAQRDKKLGNPSTKTK